MNDRTPVERLEDAIAAFVTEVDDDGGTLAGWVLTFQKTRIQIPESGTGPLSWDANYAVGSGISPFAALGLLAYAEHTIRRHTFEEDT